MMQKRLLVAARLRRPPREGWGWVDRRFMRDYAPLLSSEAILLYFFLTVVSDKQGLSFYGPAATAKVLHAEERDVVKARHELLKCDLIAYQQPLTQVLSLPTPMSRQGGPQSFGDILREIAKRD